METMRKIIGLLIIILLALPVLFAIIWAVGVTRAAVSPEILSELPQEAIAEVPRLADEMLSAAKLEDRDLSENTRAWLQAAAGVSMTPRQLLEKTGLLHWLKNELSNTLAQVGDVLRGNRDARNVYLDLRPLKAAINHEAFSQYFEELLQRLPACSGSQLAVWQDIADDRGWHEELPACRPDPQAAKKFIELSRWKLTREMPDEVPVIEGVRHFPRGINVARATVSLTYLLFLIPALFIALAALVASSSRSGFLRWSGGATACGGLLTLASALLVSRIIPWAFDIAPYVHRGTLSQLKTLILERVGDTVILISNRLFAPVVQVAEAVTVVGVILFALSFLFTSTQSSVAAQKKEPPAQTPAAT